MASMKVSTVFITGAVLLVGLVGCAQVSYETSGVVSPQLIAVVPSTPFADQSEYVPSGPAPVVYTTPSNAAANTQAAPVDTN
jgi:hypothetical protein